MTYLLILILHTSAGYAVDRIEAPSYAACEAMPTISSLPPMVPYVPPAVVRRPGSDHSHIPSLAGGKLIRRSA